MARRARAHPWGTTPSAAVPPIVQFGPTLQLVRIDRVTGATANVPIPEPQSPPVVDHVFEQAQLSADGGTAVYTWWSETTVDGGFNDQLGVWAYDFDTGLLELLGGGTTSRTAIVPENPALDAAGFVVLAELDPELFFDDDLAADPPPGSQAGEAVDRATGDRVEVESPDVWAPATVSADGRYGAAVSDAALTSGDDNEAADVLVRALRIPTVTSLSGTLRSGDTGKLLAVTGHAFTPGTQVWFSPVGITVTHVDVIDEDHLLVTVDVDGDPGFEPRDLHVLTPEVATTVLPGGGGARGPRRGVPDRSGDRRGRGARPSGPSMVSTPPPSTTSSASTCRSHPSSSTRTTPRPGTSSPSTARDPPLPTHGRRPPRSTSAP